MVSSEASERQNLLVRRTRVSTVEFCYFIEMKILCVYLLCTVVMNTTEKPQVCRL